LFVASFVVLIVICLFLNSTLTTSEFSIAELIENGFEYVCDQDDLKFFRKRK
jgi:hypothetical protein